MTFACVQASSMGENISSTRSQVTGPWQRLWAQKHIVDEWLNDKLDLHRVPDPQALPFLPSIIASLTVLHPIINYPQLSNVLAAVVSYSSSRLHAQTQDRTDVSKGISVQLCVYARWSTSILQHRCVRDTHLYTRGCTEITQDLICFHQLRVTFTPWRRNQLFSSITDT